MNILLVLAFITLGPAIVTAFGMWVADILIAKLKDNTIDWDEVEENEQQH